MHNKHKLDDGGDPTGSRDPLGPSRSGAAAGPFGGFAVGVSAHD